MLRVSPDLVRIGSHTPETSAAPQEDVTDGEEEWLFDFDDEFDLKMEELQELIHYSESRKAELTEAQKQRLEMLTNAAITLGVEDHIKIHSLPGIDNDEYEEFLEEDRRALQEFQKSINDARSHFSALTLDTNTFVSPNTAHAAQAVRTHSRPDAPKMADTSVKKSLRKEIISAFYTELKLSQDKGMTMGDGRSKRWTGKKTDLSSNAANAAIVAGNTGREAAAKRRRIFLERKIRHFTDCIDEARVSAVRPLKVGDFGLVYTVHEIFMDRVTTMYSKGGGKHGKHCAVQSTANISALSYIAVQLVEHIHGGVF
ncbi:hypothetical protein PM082_018359 [Marasmius tenuissimus]|nr:hypothetical protein PM082_018359 [Marasmius tenuissimus]